MAGHNGGRHAGINEAYAQRMTVEEAKSMPLSCDARDAARILGISSAQVQRLAKAGKLPCCKVGNQWRFSTALLVAMVRGEVTFDGAHKR